MRFSKIADLSGSEPAELSAGIFSGDDLFTVYFQNKILPNHLHPIIIVP